MTHLRTAQQYDPLGALGSRPLAVVLAFVGVVWAAACSAFSRDVAGSPTLSALTVLLVAGSAGVVAMASSPFRAPFPRSAFVAHVTLLALAVGTSTAAQWGPDRNALNDFMAVITATGLLVAAPYRPWPDLLVGGVVLAAADCIAFGVAGAAFPTSVPLGVVAFLAAAPTLVLTAAAVVFSWTFAGLAERVQIRAGSYSVERAERDGIAESVQQDRSTILARDVAPFFAELRTRESITDVDRARARAIADGIRGVMVAAADRSWLEQALAADGAESASFVDPDGLVGTMDADQRTVVRTFLRAALHAATVDPAGLRLAVEPTSSRSTVASRDASRRVCMSVDIAVADSDVGIHRTFDPYLAVLRVTFPDLEVVIRPSSLALRFSYDQH
ncbi:MAG: hypothetical protein INR72_17850 [Williamsia herbipolensis]|nr:hypothetical protein [Williamsia herbipolensis]